MLVFFPSYGLLDKVTMRWGKTGLAAALGGGGGGGAGGEEGVEPGQGQGQRQGQDDSGVLMEPRNGKELEDVLAQYYKRIDSGQPGVLLAVCRGKISEGIDFADEYARTVCVVGIPFPSVRDLQVRLKRTHQDELCRKAPSSGYLPGDKVTAYACMANNVCVCEALRSSQCITATRHLIAFNNYFRNITKNVNIFIITFIISVVLPGSIPCR